MCTLSFLFRMQSFKVDIAQCMIAKDEYIIQKNFRRSGANGVERTIEVH